MSEYPPISLELPLPNVERIVQIVSLVDRLVVLTSAGRMFERLADPRSFATGPNHAGAFLWHLMKGPLDDDA